MLHPVTPLGPWELKGSILSPTRCHLQAHATRIQQQHCIDPLIHITLTPPYPLNAPSSPFTIHRSLLQPSPSLRDLTMTPAVSEYPDTFRFIRQFLYLEPIDLSCAPPDLPLSAARWHLPVLYDAYFALAERPSLPPLSALLSRWIPIMTVLPIPETFKPVFLLRLLAHLDDSPTCLSDWRLPTPTIPACACVPLTNPPLTPVPRVLLAAAHSLRHRIHPRDRCKCPPQSVWHVLDVQRMLPETALYFSRFGARDHAPALLHVSQTLPLNDADRAAILHHLRWRPGAYRDEISSPAALLWSQNAWQMLARVRDAGMSGRWHEWRFCLQLSALKEVLPLSGAKCFTWDTSKPVCLPGADSLHVSLAVECAARKSKRLPPLMGCIKLDGDWRDIGRRRVRAEVFFVEDICGCGLRGSVGSVAGGNCDLGSEELGVAALGKVGGVPFRVMDGSQLAAWTSKHDIGCGLRIVARLLVEKAEVPVEDVPVAREGRWAQDWQTVCACGKCHNTPTLDLTEK